MNSSGAITMCVVQSRQAVSSLSTTCRALLICTRSLASAGRVMVRHSAPAAGARRHRSAPPRAG